MSAVVVLRQGDPLVMLRERLAPLVIEREVPTAISIERFGANIETNIYGAAPAWGGIGGNISNQADLQAALHPQSEILDGGFF